MVAQKDQALSHLAHEALHSGFSGLDIVLQFRRPRHDASLPHGKVAEEGNHVRADVDEQHATKTDMFVDESNDRPGDHPAALHSGEQNGVRPDKLSLGSEFLYQGCDGGPEHPEARCHKRVHQVEMPDLRVAPVGEHRHDQNDDCARDIEHHDQPPAVFAIDDDAGKGQHQHGGQCLQDGKRSQ